MKWKINSILSVLAMVLALATVPMSAAFADDDLDEINGFDVMDDSDSEEGSILDLESDESEDSDGEDVDSEDSDSEDSDSEDSDDDLDDSDSEDDSEEDEVETQ